MSNEATAAALLIITTILQTFSFSLIGEYPAGSVGSYFSVLIRVGLAALVFLPFLRTCGQSPRAIVFYTLVDTMQPGIMYLLIFRVYLYPMVSESLLFTVLIPLYITLVYDLLSERKLRWSYSLSTALAVLGTVIIRHDRASDHFWTRLLLVQLSDLCFAIGMVDYKCLMEVRSMPQHNAFAWFYVGASIVAIVAWLMLGSPQKLPTTTLQWNMLVWLDVMASGLGYFTWNYGATQVDAGMLGIMNNVHVPVGLLVNLAIWREQLHWLSFINGALVILASLRVHRRWVAPHSGQTAGGRRHGSTQGKQML